jgi:phospholipase A1
MFKRYHFHLLKRTLFSIFLPLLFLLFTSHLIYADTQTAHSEVQADQTEKIAEQTAATNSTYGIAFDEPNYILPFYYTGKPYQSVYEGQTPDDQTLNRAEFKAQLSLLFPLWKHIFKETGLFISYTQLSYWQFYAKSQYFRETNYKPAIFIRRHFLANAEWRLGLNHQSNGRGGSTERSWNRAYLDFRFSGENWMISIEPWIIAFKKDFSDLHNPDIGDYLGYGRLLLAYKIRRHTLSLMIRNVLESGFSRGALELDWSFPLFSTKLRFMAQIFSGYGQSLIEYNHYTNSAGIGLSLSNWI